MKTVLLLVDLQHDYLSVPGLSPAAAAVVRQASRLLEGCRAAGVPVVHARTSVQREGPDRRLTHWRLEDRWACVTDTHGHQWPADLQPHAGELIVDKCGFSAFEDPRLADFLTATGCERIIVAGAYLHACVRTAVLEAYRLGLRVVVADDAVTSNDPLHAAVTRRYLTSRHVAFRSVADIVRELSSSSQSQAPVHRSPRDQREVLFQIEDSDQPAIDRACERAHEAWTAWRDTSSSARCALLIRLTEAVTADREEMARLICQDVGKPLRMAEDEVAFAAALCRSAANQQAQTAVVSVADGVQQRRCSLGVVATITPWNNPLAVPLGKIAPALRFGNAVVWKPSPYGLRVADRLAQLFRDSGGDEKLLEIIHGGAEVACRLAEHPCVAAITLTGSLAAGHAMQAITASRHVPLQAELGGNNAAIVCADADLHAAAAAIASGAFGFAGQRCTANRRVVVVRQVWDAFLEQLQIATGELCWGDPRQQGTIIGPVISTAQRDALHIAIEEASRAGHRIITPHAQTPPSEHGVYFRPTIVCCDDPMHAIVQQETFGPILVAQPAENIVDALRLTNAVPQGLAAAIFSASQENHALFLSEARVGILKINQSTAAAHHAAPFGGWGTSGIGPAEHGQADVEFFTRWQAIYR